ncbi:hypothetical protein NC652_008401 [Populus alba x Populus x berolinensis]|nr:hypothetical protein NC652_008401 [Populus alba x Populus x berolinensis]
MAIDQWQMGLIYTQLQNTGDGLCERMDEECVWGCVCHTKSARRSIDFLRRGQLWRRRAQGGECGGEETTVMLRTDRAN